MVETNITPIVIVISVLLAAAIALIVYLYWRTRRIESDYELLIRDTEGHNFVQIVSDNIEQVDVLLHEVGRLSEQYAQVLRRVAGAVQHVGVVRFDAFRDLGGLLSFAVALLDDRGNGLVFSSIYGRSESRTYAKPVVERSSSYELSPEEREAIRLAMQSKELGALPVEARDREHEERMANLRLFHDREYLQRSNNVEGRADVGRRPPPEEERRPPRRPPESQEARREEQPAEPAPRQVRVRDQQKRPPGAKRSTGRVRHVGPPDERPPRQPTPEQQQEREPEPAEEKSGRPVDLVAELEIDKVPPARTEPARGERSQRERQAAGGKPEGQGPERPAPSRPRGLNTPVERLRGREPKREPGGE